MIDSGQFIRIYLYKTLLSCYIVHYICARGLCRRSMVNTACDESHCGSCATSKVLCVNDPQFTALNS